jgi:predicted nucleic acid-binding Zn ribbon protein
VRQRFSEEPLTICPVCEGQIRRVINPVGVVFKGAGFYVTDSRNGKSGSILNGSAQTSTDEKGEKNGKSEKVEKKSEETAAAVTAKADKKSSAAASATASA